MQAIGFMGFLSLRLFSNARVWDIGPLTLQCCFPLQLRRLLFCYEACSTLQQSFDQKLKSVLAYFEQRMIVGQVGPFLAGTELQCSLVGRHLFVILQPQLQRLMIQKLVRGLSRHLSLDVADAFCFVLGMLTAAQLRRQGFC